MSLSVALLRRLIGVVPLVLVPTLTCLLLSGCLSRPAAAGTLFAGVAAGGQPGDAQTSVGYNAETGELWVDAPFGIDLTSVNINSDSNIFTGGPAENLGGSFDNDADSNIFKATFGSSFGSLSFGRVARPGLEAGFLLRDLSVVGSLAGGGALGEVDLIYIALPEPRTAGLLVPCALAVVLMPRQRFGKLTARRAVCSRSAV